ncbi:hypothetical protein GZL_02176 [Streptomyces sp. 769]|nr:hypothetical protein GZL_02176 [Streptomyces sp. 769]
MRAVDRGDHVARGRSASRRDCVLGDCLEGPERTLGVPLPFPWFTP